MKVFTRLTSLAILSTSVIAISPLSTGTFYHPELGACGETNSDSDPVVAISTNQFTNGAHCFQWVEITDEANGKTAFGQVVDVCPSCSDGDIDMSPSLFEDFAPLSEGVIQVQWHLEPVGFQPPTQ